MGIFLCLLLSPPLLSYHGLSYIVTLHNFKLIQQSLLFLTVLDMITLGPSQQRLKEPTHYNVSSFLSLFFAAYKTKVAKILSKADNSTIFLP